MAVDPNGIRADAARVVEEVTKALTPGADGVEPGFATTEFWLSIVVLVGDVVLPSLHIVPATPTEQGIVAGLCVAAYNLARGIRKRGATAIVPHSITETMAPTAPSVAAMSAPPAEPPAPPANTPAA